MDAALGGADVVIIASPIKQEVQLLVTRREIKDPAQLKKKSIPVNSMAGPAVISLKMILSAFRIDGERDVRFLVVGSPANRLAALASGIVDATALAPPFTLTARKAGFNVFDSVPALREIEIPNAAIITSGGFLKQEPTVTESFVKSIIQSIHVYKTNKSKTTLVLRKYLKLDDPEELEETHVHYGKLLEEKPYPTAKSIQTVLNWSKRPDARTADPLRFIEPKILEKLDKQGFVDSLYRK